MAAAATADQNGNTAPANVNKLVLGKHKIIEPPSRGLFISDEVPDHPRARVFDPTKHSFNPLKGIDYKTARALANVLYTVYPQGENTLTVRSGKWDLLPALMTAGRLDKVEGKEEVTGVLNDLLQSPVLKSVLLKPTNFSFNPNSLIFARLNRAELGDFDALVLGLFLIGHFKGQLCVPDGGFYLKDSHTNLIREERLIVGLNFLDEVSPKLHNALLLMEDIEPCGTLYDDAVTLAKRAGLRPDYTKDDNPYNNFIDRAMQEPPY